MTATLQPTSHARRPVTERFALDGVLPAAATQAPVYGATAELLVAAVLGGTPATLFAIGGSGAGKSHTLLGGLSAAAPRAAGAAGPAAAHAAMSDAGVVARSAAALLEAVTAEGVGRKVELSAVKLDLREATDLLASGRGGPVGRRFGG